MPLGLLLLGGFLLGGTYSFWRLSRDRSDLRKSRQALAIAVVIGVCAMLALASSVMRWNS